MNRLRCSLFVNAGANIKGINHLTGFGRRIISIDNSTNARGESPVRVRAFADAAGSRFPPPKPSEAQPVAEIAEKQALPALSEPSNVSNLSELLF